jgi:hypothetical protein
MNWPKNSRIQMYAQATVAEITYVHCLYRCLTQYTHLNLSALCPTFSLTSSIFDLSDSSACRRRSCSAAAACASSSAWLRIAAWLAARRRFAAACPDSAALHIHQNHWITYIALHVPLDLERN